MNNCNSAKATPQNLRCFCSMKGIEKKIRGWDQERKTEYDVRLECRKLKKSFASL